MQVIHASKGRITAADGWKESKACLVQVEDAAGEGGDQHARPPVVVDRGQVRAALVEEALLAQPPPPAWPACVPCMSSSPS